MGTVLMRAPSTVLLREDQALVEGQQASLGMHRHLEFGLAAKADAASGRSAKEKRVFIVAAWLLNE